MKYVEVKREKIDYRLREYILNRDGYKCRYCGNKSLPLHLDHVYPVSKGGETTIQNLVTACRKCNVRKHAAAGIFPKPIGYFDDAVATESEKDVYWFLIFQAFAAMVSMAFLWLGIDDLLNGNELTGTVEIIVSAIIVTPFAINSGIMNFNSVFKKSKDGHND